MTKSKARSWTFERHGKGQDINKSQTYYLVISSLAEEKVQPAFLCCIAAEDDDGDEGEGGAGLPDLNPVGADQDEDDEQPDVGEEREDHGHNEDRVGLDPPGLPRRDDDDADGGDDEKVESSGSHDETRPQLVLLEAVEENTNDREQYFWGRSGT